ncbi:MAG: tRNA-dihydrouridine synthase [Pseudomonadota bacterium]|jgi:tRNA-dihydrouridine synthase A
MRTAAPALDRTLSVAPMMDWTDRHCRYFLRGWSPRVLLYTEMVTAEALLRGDAARFLRHDPAEHPLALQVGGSEPARLAAAARLGEDSGYLEINLNCGCPSDRVSAGAFGACLMLTPARVAECVAAMRAAVRIPVTVKMRIGVLEAGEGAPWRARLAAWGETEFARLRNFTALQLQAGCEAFVVHARQAVLGGLSPKDNRAVPPLRYDVARQLVQEFPGTPFVLNGGLRDLPGVQRERTGFAGVMLGREAYHRPAVLGELHAALWDDGWVVPGLEAQFERLVAYAQRECARGEPLAAILRHALGLNTGQPGARAFRHAISAAGRLGGTAGLQALQRAGSSLRPGYPDPATGVDNVA